MRDKEHPNNYIPIFHKGRQYFPARSISLWEYFYCAISIAGFMEDGPHGRAPIPDAQGIIKASPHSRQWVLSKE